MSARATTVASTAFCALALLVSAPVANSAAPPRPRLDVAGAMATEEARSLTFTVRLSRSASRRVTVRYATANGSASSTDFAGRRGTLVFDRGQRARRIRVELLDDPTAEESETLFLVLSSATGARIGMARATGVIAASDLPAGFTLTAALSGAAEAGAGDPSAHGAALLTFDALREQLSYSVTVEGATTSFTVAHVHRGRPPSVAAPLVRIERLPPLNGTLSGSMHMELGAILALVVDPEAYWLQLHAAEGVAVGTIGGPLVRMGSP